MLLNKYKNHKLYHNYITTVPLPGFDFIVYYAEMMTQNTVVFEHRHNLYEIFYGLEGSILFSCEGSQSELTAHDMVLLGRDRSHYLQYQSNTPAVYFTMIFDLVPHSPASNCDPDTEYQELMEVLNQADKNKYLFASNTKPQESILSKISQTIASKKIGWSSLVGQYYYQFFLDLLQTISQKKSSLDAPAGYLNIALEASKYIHANLQGDLRIDTVSQQLNVTPRHMNHLFQKMFGKSFAQTVSIIRLEHAKQRLINTDESLEQIASLVGFRSSQSLTKMFYEQEHMSPGIFRKSYRSS